MLYESGKNRLVSLDDMRFVFFSTTVNYLDRQVLSLLQTTLAEKFNWSNSDYANITAVFQFGYAISMLFAGRIIDKLGTKKGYTWAIIIWSLGAIIHPLAIPIGEAASTILGWFGIVALNVSVVGRTGCHPQRSGRSANRSGSHII